MVHYLAGRRRRIALSFVLLAAGGILGASAQTQAPSAQGDAELEATQQRKEGQVFYADGNVEIRYHGMRLRADHAEYNGVTYQVVARDHVQLDDGTQHLEADRAEFNLRSHQGRFDHVRGEVRIDRQANASVLVSPNPLTFTAERVERVDERTYRLHHAVVTVCDPRRPNWTFNAASGTLRVEQRVALVNVGFRLFRIPLIYLPYVTAPAGEKSRQSGFMLPDIGTSSIKGTILGDSYYWAPVDWADTTVGAQYLSLRGSSQTGEVRMLPWENVRLSANYFGVLDRGLPGPDGVLVPEGGHTFSLKLDALLPGHWHAVADINELSSLIFRLTFSPTFSEAVNSEVTTNTFLAKNFSGFSLSFAANNYKNFLTAQPETGIALRQAPQVRFDSVDQAPWRRWPFYFGFDSFAGGVHRSDTSINTATVVERTELAPRVTVPLHWGPWGVTPSYSFRTMSYGAQLVQGAVEDRSIFRTTGELDVDVRPPSLERVWQRRNSKWKHTIEPELLYRYVTGINEFGRFIRFDEDDTITDTNEVEYSLTQRLFRRKGDSSEEFASWRIAQKYYFDPTFGGAILPGQRNVFQALDSITPFAFADGPRDYSPIVSDIKVSPGGRYDAEVRMDYDPARRRLTTAETLVKMHPYGNFEVTLAHYAIDANATLQPLSNQIRALVGYGATNRRGWNASAGLSYDIHDGILQNELAQISYNGSCCGLTFEYARLSLGAIRNENQFRVAFNIANIGTFGNARRQDKIF